VDGTGLEGAAGPAQGSSALSTDGSTARPAISRPAWQPCGDDYPGTDCAVVRVPLDYDQPHGPTIGLALARTPATDSRHKLGTVFVNPGGPGGSGVKMILVGFGDYLAGVLGGRFDVVGFDPRGVAASEPLQCFPDEDALTQFFAGFPQFPYLPDQQRPYFDRLSSIADQCFAEKHRIIGHMSTADVARDLDRLREAVGDQRLTYLGFSYGTYIGNTYANLFPDKIRALAIDGVLDPRLWSSGWQVSSDRVATQKEFAEFLRLCDEAADDCPFAAPGGSAARYDALARALRRRPLPLADGTSFTYDVLLGDTLDAMYAPELWGGPDGYAALFAALAQAVLGDATAASQSLTLRQALRERLRPPSRQPSDYDNSVDAFFGNQCGDIELPRSFADYRAIGAYAEIGSIFGPLWWWTNAGCARWPVNADRYVGPWTARTSAPVLVVGNYFDGITDYAGAVATSTFLGNSRLLSYAGWGHTAFGRSD